MRRGFARAWLAVALALAVVEAALLFAVLSEGGTFAPTAPTASAPPWPLLTTTPAVYDGATGQDLWLFWDGATWTYANGTWSNITATAGVPTDMADNVRMVYDAADGYVLLFGGSNPRPPYPPTAQTWKFQAGRWTNLTSTVVGAPPPRVLGLMSYDSSDREVVSFGGSTSVGSPALNQTWTYSGGTWTNATVPGPPPIFGDYVESATQAMVDDPPAGDVLLYEAIYVGEPAHCEDGCPVTWTYHGGVWTNRTSGPAPLPHLAEFDLFAYDSTLGAVVADAFCFQSPSYPCGNTTGTFVLADGTWSEAKVATQPAFRLDSSWVDDPSDGGVMMVGGCCWGDFSGLNLEWQDVWVFAHGSWTESEPWGGGAPSWIESDGSWIGLGILVVAVVPALLLARPRARRGCP